MNHILTFNSGSSSDKFAFYSMQNAASCIVAGKLNRIGFTDGFLQAKNADGTTLIEQRLFARSRRGSRCAHGHSRRPGHTGFHCRIGEHAPTIRWRICQDLAFLGIRLDRRRNDANAAVISMDDSPVRVRVLKTDEEAIIARHTCHLLRA